VEPSKKFPPGARVRKTKEYENVYKTGRKISKPDLVILYCSNQTSRSRLGIIASRKVGKVNRRNLVKRRLREIYRLNRDELQKGYDLVFIARRSSPDADYARLESEVLEAFSEINLANDEIN
jgi:ribonuclease P protein component